MDPVGAAFLRGPDLVREAAEIRREDRRGDLEVHGSVGTASLEDLDPAFTRDDDLCRHPEKEPVLEDPRPTVQGFRQRPWIVDPAAKHAVDDQVPSVGSVRFSTATLPHPGFTA